MSKIAVIGNSAETLINFRGPLIRDIVSAGHSVWALAPDFNEESSRVTHSLGAVPVGISMSRLGLNPLRDALDTIKLANTLRKIKPDSTLAYFAKPAVYGSIAAFLARVPQRVAMIEGLGFAFTENETGHSSLKRRALRSALVSLFKLGLPFARDVIFLNDDDRRQMVELGAVKLQKTHVFNGIGIDLKEWDFSPPSIEPVSFILVARLLREKGVCDYVAAARIVKEQYPTTRFILLGAIDENPGSLKESEVQKWVDEGIIEWHGHVKVKPWLLNSSVCILPSYYREGIPRSLLEAMSVGRPLITTDRPGCKETVEEGVNGFLVPAHDPHAIAERVFEFIENPDLITSMGNASRLLAQRKFDVKLANERFMSLLLITKAAKS